MVVRRLWVAAALAVAAWVPARGGGGLAAVAWAPCRYVAGRVGDLLEVVELSVGVGPGAKVDAKYGVNFLGAGSVRSLRVGLRGGRPSAWGERDRQAGLFPFSLLGWPAHGVARLLQDRELAEKALYVAATTSLGTQTLEYRMAAEQGTAALRDVASMWRHTTWGESLPIGAEVHAGLVGARVMARPLELVDLAVGFVGIDLDPWLAREPF